MLVVVMSAEKPTLEKTKDLIDVASKFMLGILALCYALGLLVVNFHLRHYGNPF